MFTTSGLISTAATPTAMHIPPYHFHDGQYDCFGIWSVGRGLTVKNKHDTEKHMHATAFKDNTKQRLKLGPIGGQLRTKIVSQLQLNVALSIKLSALKDSTSHLNKLHLHYECHLLSRIMSLGKEDSEFRMFVLALHVLKCTEALL